MSVVQGWLMSVWCHYACYDGGRHWLSSRTRQHSIVLHASERTVRQWTHLTDGSPKEPRLIILAHVELLQHVAVPLPLQNREKEFLIWMTGGSRRSWGRGRRWNNPA